MKRILASIIAIFIILVTMMPANGQVTVDYPSDLRELYLKVDEEYTFNVGILNTSTEQIQVIIETEIIDVRIKSLDGIIIIEPNEKIILPITFSILEKGEFSKILRINFINTYENTTRKGTTANIKIEGYAYSVSKPIGLHWLILIIIAIIGIFLGIVKKLKGKKTKVNRRKR